MNTGATVMDQVRARVDADESLAVELGLLMPDAAGSTRARRSFHHDGVVGDCGGHLHRGS